MDIRESNGVLRVTLEDGEAHNLGDGIVVVDQLDETQPKRHRHQRVVLNLGDLESLGAYRAPSITLEDGQAELAGDGLWVIDQTDETQRGPGRHQRVVLGEADIAALWTLAA